MERRDAWERLLHRGHDRAWRGTEPLGVLAMRHVKPERAIGVHVERHLLLLLLEAIHARKQFTNGVGGLGRRDVFGLLGVNGIEAHRGLGAREDSDDGVAEGTEEVDRVADFPVLGAARDLCEGGGSAAVDAEDGEIRFATRHVLDALEVFARLELPASVLPLAPVVLAVVLPHHIGERVLGFLADLLRIARVPRYHRWRHRLRLRSAHPHRGEQGIKNGTHLAGCFP